MSIDNLVTPERVVPLGTLRNSMGEVELYYDEANREVLRVYCFSGFVPDTIRCIAPEMYTPTKNGYMIYNPKENMNPDRCIAR